VSNTQSTTIHKLIGSESSTTEDILAIEEPLEIRISYVKDFQRIESNLSVTMRTPGNDEELALGFLFTEGIIQSIDQITSVNSTEENVIIVSFREDVNFEMKKLERHFYTSSSCGVCGKTSIEAIKTIGLLNKKETDISFKVSDIYNLPGILRQQQSVFDQTGGLHASAIFNSDGQIIILKEDVGRHNALDKLIGAALQKKILPLNNYLLLLSGRASFELIQKAVMAGINIVAAVGAPSSLAVELAKERNMTLIGFLRNERFNIYCGYERIK
jgi:FdhD protein